MTTLAIYFYVLTVVAIFLFTSEKKPLELVAVAALVIRGQSSKSTSRRS